jgi:hypothetical protein
MSVKRALRLAAALAALWTAACSGEGENSFKSNRPEFDEALRKELAASNIPFREDAAGFVLYSSRHERAVREIKVRIDKELSSGIAWLVDDEPAREYLKGLLGAMGMKYSVQPRSDGIWVQWNPVSEAQKLEVQMKLVQYKARAKAAR